MVKRILIKRHLRKKPHSRKKTVVLGHMRKVSRRRTKRKR